MARKKAAPTPAPPVQGKTFWIDSKIRNWDRQQLSRAVEDRGAGVENGIGPDLDYVVLADDRRGTPGRSHAEKVVASLGGAGPTTIYLQDLYSLLLPSRAEALAILRRGPAGKDDWDKSLPPYRSPVRLDLKEADLRGLDLAGFRFHHVDLDGARLDGTILRGAWLNEARNVDFRPIGDHEGFTVPQPENCRFDGLNMSSAHFYHEVKNCSFRRVKLSAVYLGHSPWTSCDLTEADLTGTRAWDWKATDLVAEKANFTAAQFSRANLVGAKLGEVVFTDANLEGANLGKADLRGADFQRAHCARVSFKDADLRKADFRNANLAEADLTSAKVTGADFTGANLRDAHLGYVDLKKARGLRQARAVNWKAGPFLTQLAQKLAGHAGNWSLEFDLESPAVGREHCRLQCERKRLSLSLKGGPRDHYLSPKDAETGLLDLAVVHPNAVPQTDGIKVRPVPLGKTLEALAAQALCELFGQPIPAAKDLVLAKKAARGKKAASREGLVAELRGGAAGVEVWNKRSDADRQAAGDFQEADFSGADLRGINLKRANLTSANFEKANLREASLFDAKLRKANLRGADLRKAGLECVVAQGCDAEGADLREASCSDARWQRANLRNANLRGAALRGAKFEGADLTGADLTATTAASTTYDAGTKLPAGFTPGPGWRFTGTGTRPTPVVVPAPPKQDLDFATFFAKLHGVAEAGRIKNALTMLKAEKFQLFAEVRDDAVRGVVRSQSSSERVYACRLTGTGEFECGTQNLRICGGLQGMVCKHLLVLILGLAKAGALDPGRAYQWLQMAHKQAPSFDKDAMAATFFKYKGAEAGEIDWRPTETLPEDYYAL
jgi:uncharacterized protein YjbI with pentapeptide repeats